MPQITALIVGAAIFLSALAAHAQIPRSEVIVDSDRILLRDVFDGLPDNGDQPIAQAPQPGRRIVLDADFLYRLANRHRLAWRPQSRLDRVVITRAATMVGAEPIRAAMAEAYSRNAAGTGDASGHIEVDLDQKLIEIALPVGMPATVAVENLTADPTTGRFTAVITAPADGPTLARQQVAGRFVRMIDVPVTIRRVMPGDVLTMRDLDWVRVREDRVTNDVIAEVEQMIGQTPKRPLPSGQPVRIRDLQTPITVARNGSVSMIYETANMFLTSRGKALQDGATGDTIRVLNTQSNRTIDAIITGPGTVRVGIAGRTQLSQR